MQSAPKLIVGVGASAGGLRALGLFFANLPADTGCAFVVVQHLSPDCDSFLDELLVPQTSMPVRRADNACLLVANVVYVIPPDRLMTVSRDHLILAERPPTQSGNHLIDAFFQSMSVDAGPRAVAVVLSGTGTDGTEGAIAVHRAGGLVLAQTPGTAEFSGMPEHVVASGVVDHVVEAAAMGGIIAAASRTQPNAASGPANYQRIFDALLSDTGIDFAQYKFPTIERRVARRMQTRHVRTVDAYADLLMTEPAELNQLGQDFLIGVTEFFRDPAAFATLGTAVIRAFLREPGRRELRVWVVGCATGEEVYSLAILISEQAKACSFTGQISLFATDVHRGALQEASAGVYATDRLTGLSEEQIDRYFRPEQDGRRRIVPEIRQRIVFAPHNVANDPPFTRMDLVSCRNLLIYFDPALQERVTRLFDYALRPGGAIFIGSSESLGAVEQRYTVIDARQKLYRKSGESPVPAPLPLIPGRRVVTAAGIPLPLAAPPATMIERQLSRAYDHLLAHHLPAGLIVSADLKVLHYLGPVARYLSPPAGRATDSLLDRVEGDLRLAVATAVPRAAVTPGTVLLRDVRVATAAGPTAIDLLASAIPGDPSCPPLIHLQFTEIVPPSDDPASRNDAQSEAFSAAAALNERNLQLEFEIKALQQRLQAVIEELQSSNEELRSTNEEQISSNEELQSTNEELHSVNEELKTVNNGLAEKTGELQLVADDLHNLLASIDVGTVFLDRDLRIRRFNPAIDRMFNLLPGDIGRPLEHITYHVKNQPEMLQRVGEVLRDGQIVEREVLTRDGRWMWKRILPFYSSNREIHGVVLTFTDITAIKAIQRQFDLAIKSSRLVWWEWDILRDRYVTHAGGNCILGYKPGEVPVSAQGLMALVHPADLSRVQAALDDCLAEKTPHWDCEFRLKNSRGQWLWVANYGRVTERTPEGKPLALLGTMHDVNDLKRSTEAMARDAALLAHLDDAIISFDPAKNCTYWNKGAEAIFGWTSVDLVGGSVKASASLADDANFETLLTGALGGEDFMGEVRCRRSDGSHVWVDARAYAMRDENGRVTGCMVVARDITDRRKVAEVHQQLERQLQQSQKMETLGTLAGGIAHDFNNLLLVILGYTEAITEMLPPDDPVLGKLGHVRRAGQRAAALVQRILTFSRKREQPRQPVVLAQLVAESLPLLRASLNPSIEIQTNITTGSRMVLADSTQLHQVLLNLYANAGQAMQKKAGRLVIDVSAVTLTTPPPVAVGTVSPGKYLSISIEDNGTGMTPETAARAFEPFFTTKRVSDGTGLGLSIVHGIITSHAGAVQLSTRPGRGTVISILLPEVLGLELPESAPAAVPRHGRGERVAVIDDEESVAALTHHALEQRGFHVTSFTSPTDFLDHLGAHPGEFDFIVTDQAMPAMTGSALTGHLRLHGHRFPVLIISGYARSLTAADLRKLAPADFLAKPFTFDQLAQAVAQLIDQSTKKDAP